jgi:hypothetical protein
LRLTLIYSSAQSINRNSELEPMLQKCFFIKCLRILLTAR